MNSFVGNQDDIDGKVVGYGIAIAPFLYSALARYAMTDEFGVFFDINGRWADFNNHTSEATALWANVFGLNLLMLFAIPIGLILCCIPGLVAIAAYTPRDPNTPEKPCMLG